MIGWLIYGLVIVVLVAVLAHAHGYGLGLSDGYELGTSKDRADG